MAESPQISNNIAARGLSMLKKLRRLDGAGIISDGVLVHWDLPLEKEGADALARRVVEMLDGWNREMRPSRHVLLAFDGGTLLASSEGSVTLLLLFKDPAKTALMVTSAEEYLQQYAHALGARQAVSTRVPLAAAGPIPIKPSNGNHPKPEPVAEVQVPEPVQPEPQPRVELDPGEAWEEYRQDLERLFSKVLGSAMAQRNIQRELSSMGISRTGFLKVNQFRPFGQRMIDRVKDRQVRKQLEAELSALMSRF